MPSSSRARMPPTPRRGPNGVLHLARDICKDARHAGGRTRRQLATAMQDLLRTDPDGFAEEEHRHKVGQGARRRWLDDKSP